MKNEELYKKNMSLLREKFPSLLDKIMKEKRKESELQVEEVAGSGERLLPQVITKEGRKLVLNGVYGEEERASCKIESWGKLPHSMPIFFYGFANLELMKKIYEALKEDCIMYIYEPSIEILEYYLYREDMEPLLTEWPVFIDVGEYNEIDFKNTVAGMIQVDTLASFKIEIAPNYEILFEENLSKTISLIKDAYHNYMVNWETMKRYTDVVGNNILKNMHYLFHGYGIQQLKGALNHEFPAIVVSAGPSLNKNINDLKAAVGKACIIAVDTAIKPLLNHGIKPDFFAIVDGLKPTSLMDHPQISEIPMITAVIVADGIMNLHTGKKIFYTGETEPEASMWDESMARSAHKKAAKRMLLPSGGSVANSAFSFARLLDPTEIILVGQDLALKNDRTHADGTFKEKMGRADDEVMEKTFLVDGIRGNKVKTLPDFNKYREWFEDVIKRDGMKNVIDATQGGAKIHGTRIMTLRKAIEKYCTKEFDMGKILSELPEMFDYSAKCKFLEEYTGFPESLGTVEKNADKAYRLYKKMLKIGESENDMDVEALTSLLKKIKKLNDFMNEDKGALFVQGTMEHLNFVMRMGIYQEEEDEKANVRQMAKEGMAMNLFIKSGAHTLKEQAEELLGEKKLEITKEDIHYPIDRLVWQLRERKEKAWK
ncbi:Uncharacterized conserved protein [Lachnospiraceae bacterium XBB1006]|nr:Uncharacterized conserved protein [Lachnospiraceae bacterium XBB1006]